MARELYKHIEMRLTRRTQKVHKKISLKMSKNDQIIYQQNVNYSDYKIDYSARAYIKNDVRDNKDKLHVENIRT